MTLGSWRGQASNLLKKKSESEVQLLDWVLSEETIYWLLLGKGQSQDRMDQDF